MPKHNLKSLLNRARQAGLSQTASTALFKPDWWGPENEGDAGSLAEVEARVSWFFRVPLAVVRDAAAALSIPSPEGVQLKNAKQHEREEFTPAIHVALAVARAALPNLTLPQYRPLPADALDWRNELIADGATPTLEVVLEALWSRGIPVLHIADLPTPRFHGLATMIGGRAVIVVSHALNQPAAYLFNVAHEAGHLAHGHCAESIVVDGEDDSDQTGIEKEANDWARLALLGTMKVPEFFVDNARQLAIEATDAAARLNADAALILRSYAFGTGHWAQVNAAIKKIDAFFGGPERIADALWPRLSLAEATESERALLSLLPPRAGLPS